MKIAIRQSFIKENVMTARNKDIVEAVKILNRVFKKEKIKSTIDQIYADLATCGRDNALKIKEGIDNNISYLNCSYSDDWQPSYLWCRVSAIYLMLTTWDEEYSKKYKGESADNRLAFVNKIADFIDEQEQKKQVEFRRQVEIEKDKLRKEFAL
jgi:hypothetical protein